MPLYLTSVNQHNFLFFPPKATQAAGITVYLYTYTSLTAQVITLMQWYRLASHPLITDCFFLSSKPQTQSPEIKIVTDVSTFNSRRHFLTI